MGLFKKKKKAAANTTPMQTSVKFDVAGLEYRLDAMYDLLEPNPNYKNPKSTEKPVYKYKYFGDQPCELIAEPKNEYDKNAIKVVCRGQHLGYVPSFYTDDVRGYLKAGYVPTIFISPKHYKVYEDDEWVTYKKDPYATVTLHR